MSRLRSNVGFFSAYLRLAACAILVSSGCGDDASSPSAAGHGGDSGGAGHAGEKAAGAGGSNASGSGGSGGTAGSSDDVELYGTFNVTLVPALEETMTAAMTQIIGRVRDGETPEAAVWKLEMEQGGCKLYVPNAVLCQPSCGSSAVCADTNMCKSYPNATSVGIVTLTGVGASPISMDVIAGNYQPKAGTMVPYPPCAEGDMVALEADGGGHGKIEIKALCVAPLEFPGPIMYERGAALKVTWKAPGKSTGPIAVKLDLSHHGGSKGKIECEVPDNGSFEVPATLMDRLVDLGVAGFPTVSLTRSSVATGSGNASHVELDISSPQERPVVIPGLTSCSEDKDCPSGKTCQTDRSCK
jgi:hypothetical protein